MLIPRQKTPALALPTVANGAFDLATETSQRGTVVCFYRGLHCPICATYLTELERQTPKFAERGFGTIAISTDGADRAAAMAEKIKASQLRIAYDLSLQQAREWGLYLSAGRGKTSIGIEEPELFSEPGVFILREDQTLYYGSVQTMPFVRPHFADFMGALDFTTANDYPARGEFTGEV
ncbi:peroxiredoxin-like family protein [Paracoccus tegillarcae]|uniref:Alkyl hydroperoxide reductase n=1 Tax=Paracoccus tegillarcae TaxID=1529068 RepID=A0A2K9F7V0_9RHOB|nr:peroxiredoxin-like family protein [Paracoccus tegillarcae]AUH35301.1 alkyl hydroperoxide reductase [Paracoccus tegillarcae]